MQQAKECQCSAMLCTEQGSFELLTVAAVPSKRTRQQAAVRLEDHDVQRNQRARVGLEFHSRLEALSQSSLDLGRPAIATPPLSSLWRSECRDTALTNKRKHDSNL